MLEFFNISRVIGLTVMECRVRVQLLGGRRGVHGIPRRPSGSGARREGERAEKGKPLKFGRKIDRIFSDQLACEATRGYGHT